MIKYAANSEDKNYLDLEFVCYLTGDEGELTLNFLNTTDGKNNYIKSLSIQCEELEKTAIKGTVTSSSTIPDGTCVVATNKTTGLQYKIAQIRASARSILCAGTAHGPPPFSKSNKKNSPPLALSEKIWFCCGKALIFFGNRTRKLSDSAKK